MIFARKNATTATRYAANRLEESILESFQACDAEEKVCQIHRSTPIAMSNEFPPQKIAW